MLIRGYFLGIGYAGVLGHFWHPPTYFTGLFCLGSVAMMFASDILFPRKPR